ncbi:glucose N-acetyltransferase [Podospora fimiseda]|uniref:Glucose N-acetyltransferase n=1 Tax=Podospora fimiseda TaxID=252190 RepID=A0AAN7BUY2_9PEZI|nr:glucose N-acetyltransferase [Podospora fimiseda]
MFISTKKAVVLTVFFSLIIFLGFLSTKLDAATAKDAIKTAAKSAHGAVKSAAESAQEKFKDLKESMGPPPKTPSHHHDWDTVLQEGKFAYVMYATDMDYLCNTIINHARLTFHGVKHDQVLIYPKEWDDEMKGKHNYRMMQSVRKDHHRDLKFRPSELLISTKGETTWGAALTKLHAFELTEYSRVLAFDSDSLILRNMNHYFQAPRAALAVPRAYWLTEKDSNITNQVLGSHVMLLEPNKGHYRRLVEEAKTSGNYDMEVINHMFKDSAMILPHRGLALLTGEFRLEDHSKYLAGDDDDTWDPVAEAASAYMVHFSDWPLPKPWEHHSDEQWNDALPKCPGDGKRSRRRRGNRMRRDGDDCPDRVVWKSFYEKYAQERSTQCKFLTE